MRRARPAAGPAAAAAAAVAALLLLSGCSDQLGDRESGAGKNADRIGDVGRVEVYRDADNFPNVARICVDGLGFSSTSSGWRGGEDENERAAPALSRVPEWDATCRNATNNSGDS